MKPEFITLHRYFIWADRMRKHFDDACAKVRDKLTLETPEFLDCFLYMSYWYGGLNPVIEGWRELKLKDERIDALLESPNVELLRRYRNGAFHFQKEYFDARFNEFMSEKDSAKWVQALNSEFSRWFLEQFGKERA